MTQRRRSGALRFGGLWLGTAVFLALSSCSYFVQYTDEIDDRSSTGRSVFVTTPATLGGSAGFIVGLPADIGLLPLTYPFYLYQKSVDPVATDPLSTLLFPSFVCWRLGKFVLGAPFDALEYVFYRAWRGERTRTRAERESIEFEYDQETLPTYPVEPIYPLPEMRRLVGAAEFGYKNGLPCVPNPDHLLAVTIDERVGCAIARSQRYCA